MVNPLNAELNPICHLLALLGAHHILHVSRIRVNAGEGALWNVMSTKKKMMITQPGRSEESHAVAGPCRLQLRSVSGDTSIMETGHHDITPQINHLHITTTKIPASSSKVAHFPVFSYFFMFR